MDIGIIGLGWRIISFLHSLRWRGRFAHLRGLPKPERRLLTLVLDRCRHRGELERQWPTNSPMNTNEANLLKVEALNGLMEDKLMADIGLNSVRAFREIGGNLTRLGLIGCHSPDGIYPFVRTLFITELGEAALRECPQLRLA